MLAVKSKRNEFERQALVHIDALYGAAYRLTRNARDAEDLVQDSLLRAFRFWDSFEQDSNCKAWLLRIVTNTFINEYQRKKRSREVLDAATAEQDATDGVLVHAHAGDKQSPDQALLQQRHPRLLAGHRGVGLRRRHGGQAGQGGPQQAGKDGGLELVHRSLPVD